MSANESPRGSIKLIPAVTRSQGDTRQAVPSPGAAVPVPRSTARGCCEPPPSCPQTPHPHTASGTGCFLPSCCQLFEGFSGGMGTPAGRSTGREPGHRADGQRDPPEVSEPQQVPGAGQRLQLPQRDGVQQPAHLLHHAAQPLLRAQPLA